MADNKTQIVISAKDETGPAFRSVEGGLNQLKGAATTLVPVLGGIGAALTVGAFAESISNTIKFAAALDDMAERTGASVENLSALSGVAKIGGHDLGMVESSVIKLNKALHGSDDESKGAAKALAALGLSVDELRAKDPAEAMLDVAKALDKFADGGGKSAAAIAILGKQGAQALPFLKDLAEKGELVGKVTAEQAAQAEQYEKNMAKLSMSLSSASKAMALEMLPALTRLSSEMAEGIGIAGGFWNAVAAGATINPFKTTGENIKSIKADLEKMEADQKEYGYFDDAKYNRKLTQLKMLKAAQIREALGDNPESNMDANDRKFARKLSLDNLDTSADKKPKKTGGTKVDEAAQLIQRLNEQIEVKNVDALTTDKMTASEKEAVKVRYQLDAGTLKATASQRAAINADLDKLVALDKTLQAQKEYAAALDKQEATNVKANQSMLDQIANAERAAEVYGLTEAQISAVEQARLLDAIAIAKENGATDEMLVPLREELELRGKLTEALSARDLKAQGIEDAKKAVEALSDMDQFAIQAARNIQDAFSEFLFDPFSKGAGDMVKSFGQTIQKMIAQAASAQILKALFGDNFAKTGELGGFAASAFNWVKGIFSFADGGIMTSAGALPLNRYAMGGIANSPQLAMFGEGRTPEAYVPLPDGRRIPVAMQGGQGGTVVQHLNFYGAAEPAQVKRAAAAGYRNAAGAMSTAGRYA